jgi:hypothetical protein
VTDIRGSGFDQGLLARVGALPGVEGTEAADGLLTVFWKETADTAALLRLLLDGGARIDELAARKATFEDAFLKLVKDEEKESDPWPTI